MADKADKEMLVPVMRGLNLLTIISIAVCFMIYGAKPSDEDNVYPVHTYKLSYGRTESQTSVDDKLTVNIVQNGVLLTDIAEKNVWAFNGYEEKFYESQCHAENQDRLSGDMDLGHAYGQTAEEGRGIVGRDARGDDFCNAIIHDATGADLTNTDLTKALEVCRLTAGCKVNDDGDDCVPTTDTCTTRATALDNNLADGTEGKGTIQFSECTDVQGEPACEFVPLDDDGTAAFCRVVLPSNYYDSRDGEGEDCEMEQNAWGAAMTVFWLWVGFAFFGTVGVLAFDMAFEEGMPWKVVFAINCVAFALHLTFIAVMLWAFSVENDYNMHESGLFKMLKVGHEDTNGYKLKIDYEHGTGYYLLMSTLLLSILSGCFTFFRIGHVYSLKDKMSDTSDNNMLYAKMSLL